MNPGDLIQIWRHRHCIGIFLGKDPAGDSPMGDSLVVWYPSEYTDKSNISLKINKVDSRYLEQECIVILKTNE